jgi:hypothetical protein
MTICRICEGEDTCKEHNGIPYCKNHWLFLMLEKPVVDPYTNELITHAPTPYNPNPGRSSKFGCGYSSSIARGAVLALRACVYCEKEEYIRSDLLNGGDFICRDCLNTNQNEREDKRKVKFSLDKKVINLCWTCRINQKLECGHSCMECTLKSPIWKDLEYDRFKSLYYRGIPEHKEAIAIYLEEGFIDG